MIVFGKDNCPECIALKNYLEHKGFTYEFVNVEDNGTDRMLEFTEPENLSRSLPQLELDGILYVGFARSRKAIDGICVM